MFIVAIIAAVIAVLAFIAALFVPATTEYDGHPKRIAGLIGAVFLLIALIFGILASVYTQSVGQARVIINAGGTISHVDDTPGFGWKAPWQKAVDFDLISQSLTYAGNDEGAPSYTNGDVQGQQVTAAAKGGAQMNFDASVTYDLVGADYAALYSDFQTQERFTRQRVEREVRDTLRDVPSAYTPNEFRGDKQGEATDKVLAEVNESLNKFGVEVTSVVLENIRFSDQVEESIRNVEVAQQKEAQAQADLRAAEVAAQTQVVEAQAEAEAAVAKAQGQAEANRLLTESLSPQVLQQRYIDALAESGQVYVVPEGSQPIVPVTPQP